MTEVVQRFLLRNTVFLQKLVNDKLAKRPGSIGKFFKWMEIGPRNNGGHVIPRLFRVWNTYILDFGFRFNYSRPHILKGLTKEREIYTCGYAAIFLVFAWYSRKNKIRPLHRYRDSLHEYDNPANMSLRYGTYVPFNNMNYRTSAHYLEIGKIVTPELFKRVTV